jgi:phosphotriesterase-related protein
VLLSMDIATLNDLQNYGGKGFDYLLLKFIPLLRELGATEEDVQVLLIENPQRALAFSEPQRPQRPD